MGRSWYFDVEEKLEERQEAIAREHEKAQRLHEEIFKNEVIARFYTHKNGQISIFEESEKLTMVGSTRAKEYVCGDHTKIRRYVEEYGPEIVEDGPEIEQ